MTGGGQKPFWAKFGKVEDEYFVKKVLGVQDEGVGGESTSKARCPGYCFSVLFTGAALEEVMRGPSVTTCAALRRAANSHGSPYSTGSYGLLAGRRDGGAVWHVVDGPLGPSECLALMDKTALVGAPGDMPNGQRASDVSTEVHALGAVVRAEAAKVPVVGPVLRRRFNWSLTLLVAQGESDYAIVNPTTVPRVVSVARLFESVRLVKCAVVLSVSPQLDTVVGVAFGTQGFGPPDMGALRARPHSMMCYGRNDGWHRHLWDLPDQHNFGRDYKMKNPGNPVGHLAIKIQGANLAEVDVDGYFDIEFAGEGVPDPVRLKPSQYSDKSAVAAAARGGLVSSNLRPGRLIVPGEDSDSGTEATDA